MSCRVLVIAEDTDADASELARRLADLGLTVQSFRLGREATNYAVTGERLPDLAVCSDGAELSVAAVERSCLVVYRRAAMRQRPVVMVPSLEADARAFAEREWEAVVHAVLLEGEMSTPVWTCPPSSTLTLRNKVWLMARAARYLSVPRYSIGTTVGGPWCTSVPLVTKAINADEQVSVGRYFATAVLTPRLREQYLGTEGQVPTLVQQHVTVVTEVRAFVVGRSVLPYRVQTSDGVVDSRLAGLGRMRVLRWELPASVSAALVQLAEELRLAFCTADLLLDEAGVWHIIDVTPHGSWGYYDMSSAGVGEDIANAFADLVHGTCPRRHQRVR